MMKKILIALAVLAAVFLLGYVPSALRARSLEAELRAAREEAGFCALRGHAAMMLAETVRNNFGLALQHATAYFDNLRDRAQTAAGANERQAWEALLAKRDAITAALAKADPAVQSEVLALFMKTEELARR